MRELPTLLRPIVALALATPVFVAAPPPAHAEGTGGFLGVAGGVSLPLGDDAWTDLVESSPNLGVRAGSVPRNLGGMISADWTPVSTNNDGGTFPGGSSDVSAHRFRILGNVLLQIPFQKLIFEGRAGIGLDIAHASYELNAGPINFSASDTDLGLGFEFGGGMWFDVGSVLVGGELALPIATHDHQADEQGEISFDYTSYDINLMFGVRFVSK